MRSVRHARCLSVLVSVCLTLGLLPGYAFANLASGVSAQSTSGPHQDGELRIMYYEGDNGGQGSSWIGTEIYSDSTVHSSMYDWFTNTLTLRDHMDRGVIHAERMGDDFTIRVEGTNLLDGIDLDTKDGWGCGLNIVGNGTLTLNDMGGIQERVVYPIDLGPWESMAEDGVTSDAALHVAETVTLRINPTKYSADYYDEDDEVFTMRDEYYPLVYVGCTTVGQASSAIDFQGRHDDYSAAIESQSHAGYYSYPDSVRQRACVVSSHDLYRDANGDLYYPFDHIEGYRMYQRVSESTFKSGGRLYVSTSIENGAGTEPAMPLSAEPAVRGADVATWDYSFVKAVDTAGSSCFASKTYYLPDDGDYETYLPDDGDYEHPWSIYRQIGLMAAPGGEAGEDVAAVRLVASKVADVDGMPSGYTVGKLWNAPHYSYYLVCPDGQAFVQEGTGGGSAADAGTGSVPSNPNVVASDPGSQTSLSQAVRPANPLKVSVSASAKTVKASKLAKKAQKVSALKVTKAVGKVAYKNVSTSKKLQKFRVAARTGKITVLRGTKKGTYKVRVQVMASGNVSYRPATKIVTCKIKVK